MKIPGSIIRITILIFISTRGIVYAQTSAAGINPFLFPDTEQSTNSQVHDLISRLMPEEKAILLNHTGPVVERFNIKPDGRNHSLHGVRWKRPATMCFILKVKL